VHHIFPERSTGDLGSDSLIRKSAVSKKIMKASLEDDAFRPEAMAL
jgi:hypothetical protein